MKACKDGWVHRQKHDFVKKYYGDIESGERTLVGVNKYRTPERQEIPVFELDPAYEKKQIERLNEARRSRDDTGVAKAMDRLRAAYEDGENSMEATVAAVKAYATVGEIVGLQREVFGKQGEPAANFAAFK